MNFSDYQNAASLARACVETGAGVDKETLEGAVKDMAAAVVEVNVRLRKAAAELRANNIDQAVLLCEISPNLIESVEVLYLAEQDMWQQLVESQGLSLGEPLLVDRAGDLNEAYALQQPLAELMKRHRLLAIAHAPLAERLAVLRKLNEVDPDNFIWQEDVEAFEKERHKHIAKDVQTAAATRDLAAARRLASELNETPWIMPPDETLARNAMGLVNKLKAEGIYQQLSEVAHNLELARQQGDHEWVVALRSDWDGLVGQLNLRDNDPLWQQVLPIFEWMDEEDRLTQTANAHTKALIRLKRMIDRKEPIAAIDRHAAKTKRNGPIPKDLTQRIESYRESVVAKKQRRVKIVMIAWAVGLLVALIVFGWLWFQASNETAHKEQMVKIEKLFKNEQHQQVVDAANASSFTVQNDPYVEEWVEESQKTLAQRAGNNRKLKTALANRQKATAVVLTRAEAVAADDNVTPGQIQQIFSDIKNAKIANGESRSDSFFDAYGDMTKGTASAMLELDAGIDRLIKQLNNAHSNIQNASDNIFVENYLELKSQYDRLTPINITNLGNLRHDYRLFIDTWKSVVSQKAQENASELGSNLNSAIAQLELRNKYADDLSQLSQSVIDRSRYQSEAEKFVENYSSQEKLTERKRALREDLAIWDAIDAYNQIAAGWDTMAVNTASKYDRQELKAWQTAASAFVENYPLFFMRRALIKKIEFSQGVLGRSKALDPIFSLQEEFKDPIYTSIKYYETPGGDWGYYQEDPLLDSENDVYRFKSFADVAGKVTETKSVKSTPHPTLDEPARHCECIKQGDKFVDAVMTEPYSIVWEDLMWKVIRHFVDADESADPLVRYKILRKMLQTATMSSSAISHVASDDFARFNEAVPDPLQWLSQGKNTDTDRRSAKNAIRKLQGRLPSLIDDEQKIRLNLKEGRFDRYKAIGVLDQDGEKWVVRCPGKQNSDAEIFVAGPGGLNGQLQPLGRLISDTNEIRINQEGEALKIGRPVFKQESKIGS